MLKHEVAAVKSVWTRIANLRQHSADLLAPQMRTRVLAFVHECEDKYVTLDDGSEIPLDVRVFETLRTDDLQAIYFEQGTSKARTALWSWHGYGLAIDVISRQFEWFGGEAAKTRWPSAGVRNRVGHKWFTAVATIAKRHGLKWGGDWTTVDLPHLYFGTLRATPSDVARKAIARGGKEEVWRLVGAA